jgi:glycosyltransferase involved in cell wall biosynthesis
MSLPQNVAIVSFEGPDRYSSVGGLAVRVTELARALCDAGVRTDLYFIGDPEKPKREDNRGVRLHRLAQSVSKSGASVYDREREKIDQLVHELPDAIASEIVAPAMQRRERMLLMCEDWQIAPIAIALDASLWKRNLRSGVQIVWNANNTYGFERMDFPALAKAAHLTCVSKFMKFELARYGVEALVIPNGIPQDLPERFDAGAVEALRLALAGRPALLKVGRYSPDKRWLQAVDGCALLKKSVEVPPRLFIRGSSDAYGDVVLARARERGLTLHDLVTEDCTPEELARALSNDRADVVVLKSFLPDETLYALYGAVDAVLANSGKEPFGLVGLEVMALRGIAVCGSTGEDYAQPFWNAIVCDTDDPRELADYLKMLLSDVALSVRIRENALETARRYAWPAILEILAAKLSVLDQLGDTR